VSAAFNHTPALQHTNAVAADNCAEAVSNHDGCGALLGLKKLIYASLHNRFALAVESTGGLVKQHNLWPSDQAPRDANALSLTAAKLHRRHTGADQRVVTILQPTRQ
jgi:hypothetical protein